MGHERTATLGKDAGRPVLVVEHRPMSPSESRAGTLVAVVFLAFVGVCSGQQGLRGRANDTSRFEADLTTLGILGEASEEWLRGEEAAFKQAVERLSDFRASDVLGTGALLDGSFIRSVNERSPSRDDLLPMCGWVEPIVELQLYCPTLRYIQAQLRPSIVQHTLLRDTGMYQHEHEPANDGTLPQPLVDVGTPLPYLIDREVMEQERKTVYWYYRLILNLYGYCVRWVRSRGENVAPSLVPSGYHDSRIFLLDEGWSSWRARFQVPIAQSMVKRDHLVVLLRGTLLPGGWLSDATYAYAPESVSRAFGYEGRVHQGFLNFTLEVLPDVEAEVDRHPNITRVTLAGHSLGGAVGTLLADYLARKRPDLTIELLAIAGPNVGNKVFVKGFNTRVRARHIMYLGDGSKTESGPFGFGDLIPQIPPPCWPVPSCDGVLFANPAMLEGDGWAGGFEYQLIGGNVAIYATDLPNTEAWLEKERLVTRDSSLASCHVCSYLCWSVQGLDDPEDRCYFTTQGDEHPWPCPYSTLGERLDNIWSMGTQFLEDFQEDPASAAEGRAAPVISDGNI